MGYYFLLTQKWSEHNDTKFGWIRVVVSEKIDRFTCSVGGELGAGRRGARSLPPAKTEGAHHRLSYLSIEINTAQ